jgi:hypothetical protein
VIGSVLPGTAADNSVFAVAAFDPRRAVRRRALVILVQAILRWQAEHFLAHAFQFFGELQALIALTGR